MFLNLINQLPFHIVLRFNAKNVEKILFKRRIDARYKFLFYGLKVHKLYKSFLTKIKKGKTLVGITKVEKYCNLFRKLR